MLNVNDRFDNTMGDPIFQPELTGAGLPPEHFADWEAFCLAVVTNHEKVYQTWFENRYRRQGRDRAECVVKAEAHGNAIIIRCPSGAWAAYMREAVTGDIRRLCPRPFFILGPHEMKPRAATRGDVEEAIAIAEEMRVRPDDEVQKLGPATWSAYIHWGRSILDRHNEGRRQNV